MSTQPSSSVHPRPPRVAVLWARVTGYVHAELTALVEAGAEVLLVRRESAEEAPFAEAAVTAGFESYTWSDRPDVDDLAARLERFQPDMVLICSWDVGGYRQLGRALRGRTLRVLTMDNQWWGTAKQWAGVLTSRFVIRPTYDAAFVPGDRQAEFARRLGFDDADVLWGLNTCDTPRFAAVAEARGAALPPPAFLFAGRLVADKAIDVLADAYAAYRAEVTDPWPLLVAGVGPEARHLAGVAGVEQLGFVQPDDLPAVFGRAGCLVLPSRFEPWALVIHEAVAAGLPVVATRCCGATTRLVLDGYNGAVIAPDDRVALRRALVGMHRLTRQERARMGEAGRSLAGQYTPERWARTLLSHMPELRARHGLEPAPWAATLS